MPVQEVHVDTRQMVTTINLAGDLPYIRTAGYHSVGDGGGALYKRVASQPSHEGKVQSADGAWWELSEVQPNLLMFGARADGSTDDTSAWNAALGYCFAFSTARKLILPNGYIKLSGQIGDIYKPITIEGAGRRNTVVMLHGTTGIAIRGNGVRAADIRFSDWSINGHNMSNGEALVIDFAQATVLENFSIFDPFNGIYMRQMGNAVFNNVKIDGTIRGSFGWKAYGTSTPRNGENDQIDVIEINNCLVQSTYQGDTNVPAAELFVLDGRVHSININGLRCLSGLRGFVTRNTPGLPLNFAPQFIIGSGLEAENTYAEGMLFAAGSAIRLDNVFVARSFRFDGVVVGETVGTLSINKAQFGSNYGHGINNYGCAILTLDDVQCYNNGLAAGNTKSGLYLSGRGRTYVQCGTYGKATWLPSYSEPQKFGIELAASFSGEVKINNVNLTGNLTGSFYDNGNTILGSHVKGCSGYNPRGTTLQTVGASPFVYTSGLSDEAVNIYSGSGVVVSIDGVAVANQTPCSFFLSPRKSATIAYLTVPFVAVNRS